MENAAAMDIYKKEKGKISAVRNRKISRNLIKKFHRIHIPLAIFKKIVYSYSSCQVSLIFDADRKSASFSG